MSPFKSPPFESLGSRDAAVVLAISAARSLILTVAAENEGLAKRKPMDFAAHSRHKSQALLQIGRIGALLRDGCDSATLRSTLAELRSLLSVNQRLLEIQLRAARAVSNVIANAIRESSSDGTYSAQSWRRPSGV